MAENFPSGPRTSRTTPRPVEWSILGAIWRYVLPIALVTGAAVWLFWIFSQDEVKVYPIRTELLVRIGYEYSPVPWGSVSETQQINIRADEVIGTEIQLISSVGMIRKALEAAPHSLTVPGADGGFNAAHVQLVQEKLAVKRLEGSNVILVEVTDADPAWSSAFLDALVKAYLVERKRLFSDESYRDLLDDREAEMQQSLAYLDEESRAVSLRIGTATAYLREAALGLSATLDQTELRTTLASRVAGLRIYVDGLEGTSSLADALDELDQALSPLPEALPAASNPAPIPEDLLTAVLDELASDTSRLNTIRPQQDTLLRQIETIKTAQLRHDLRGEVSNSLTVMTPPHQLATPNGLDRVQKTILAGLVAFILSSLFFVYLDGRKRGSLRRREDV